MYNGVKLFCGTIPVKPYEIILIPSMAEGWAQGGGFIILNETEVFGMRHHRISPLLLCADHQWEAVLWVMTAGEMIVPGLPVVRSSHL